MENSRFVELLFIGVLKFFWEKYQSVRAQTSYLNFF